MASKRRTNAQRWLRRTFLLVATLLASNCGTTREGPTGGETHFLQHCQSDPDCGGELVCACGVCTLACSERSTCEQFADAVCRPVTATTSCQATSVGLCDVSCVADNDCASVSASHRCLGGVCRDVEGPKSECVLGNASANEVVVLGDSFFALSHSTTAFLEDLAREAGNLSVGERYRDYSSVVGNALAFGGTGIANQYEAAAAESRAKLVVMTGGGADVLLGSCDVIGPDCPLLVEAAQAARALFQRMADSGVEHVVYAFYPDPVDPVLREEVRALRPLLASACEESPVPCEWLDLRTAFADNETTYLDSTGTSPTSAGAQATARAIWATMRGPCGQQP